MLYYTRLAHRAAHSPLNGKRFRIKSSVNRSNKRFMAFWHDIFNRCYCIHINLVCFVDGARPAAVSDADDDAIYCISPQYVTLFFSIFLSLSFSRAMCSTLNAFLF